MSAVIFVVIVVALFVVVTRENCPEWRTKLAIELQGLWQDFTWQDWLEFVVLPFVAALGLWLLLAIGLAAA